MMKSIRYIIGCLLVWLVSCQQHEVVNLVEEPVELSFKLSVSENGSRGNVSENPTNTTNWTQVEKVVDGRYLYTVSVYLVDANKKIVAYKDVTVDNQATEKTVTFDKSYNLNQGTYTLMAVANHEDYTVGETTCKSGLSADWGTIGVNTSADVLLNKTISSSSDFISPKEVIQPLSLMKVIELHAGQNVVEGELVRTFARLRIEVKNNSGSLPLEINNLTFSDNFTQNQAYVFDDGTDRKYLGKTGAPVVTSGSANLPFSAMEIGARTSAVIFDAYLLESKAQAEENYTYTLGFSYDVESEVLRIAKELNQVNQIAQSDYENCYFLIQNINSKRFLYRDYDILRPNGISLENLQTLLERGEANNYLWKLEAATSEDYYNIKNIGTGEYINYSLWDVSLDQNIPNPLKFISNLGDGIQIQCSEGQNLYLCEWDSWYGGYESPNGVGNYVFYVVDKKLGYSRPIVLTTIDPVSQQSSPVTAIKRNDFINVLVTVSYNPVAGKFEFVVEDWNQGGGNIEFN